MAIWQFECNLIPQAALVSRFGNVPTQLSADVADDEAWWAEQQPPDGYRSVIESFSSGAESWSDSILMWGREDGDRVHVVFERKRVVSIACRLDLRQFSQPFAQGVLRIAEFCSCLLWPPPDCVFQPEWHALLEAIRVSDSARFVQNPHVYLEELSRSRSAN